MSEEDRAFNYLSNSLRETLKHQIGEPVSEESKTRLKDGIKQLMDALASDKKMLEIGVVSAQYLRDKLQQQSVVPSILPAVKGPFVPWREDDNVTHWSCFLGDIPIEQHVRLCDFRGILMGAACEGEAISCLACLTAPEAVDL